MAQSWIKSVLKDLDPSLLDNLSITQEYPRVIIDVNWKVVGLKESTNVLNHDMLTIVAEDESGQVFDIMITEPFYPRGVSSLDQLVGAEVVAVLGGVEDVGALEPLPLDHAPGLEGQTVEEHEVGHRRPDDVLAQLLRDVVGGVAQRPSDGEPVSSVHPASLGPVLICMVPAP